MGNKNRQKSIKVTQCPLYDNCKVRLHPLATTDRPNAVAHLGFRFFYTLIAWFVLGFKINEGFFLAMCFFALPVFMDCVKFTPLNEYRKIIKFFEVGVSGLLVGISFLGVIGIYAVENISDSWLVVCKDFVVDLPSGFSVEVIWWILAAVVFITAVDWFCDESQLERAVIENL